MSENVAPEGYDPADYDRPSVAVDLVVMGLRGGLPAVLLVARTERPFAGRRALPGGFVGIDEALDAAARRVLRAEAGIACAHLEQLYTFGAVDRDPRMRVIAVAYLVLLDETAFARALAQGPDLLAAVIEVPWAGEGGGPVIVRPCGGDREALPLAFDHADILALAVRRMRGKLDYSGIGFALLPERFTLRALQDVHEAVLGTPLNKPAFRRRMLDRGWLEPTGEREADTSFRPAELYRVRRPA